MRSEHFSKGLKGTDRYLTLKVRVFPDFFLTFFFCSPFFTQTSPCQVVWRPPRAGFGGCALNNHHDWPDEQGSKTLRSETTKLVQPWGFDEAARLRGPSGEAVRQRGSPGADTQCEAGEPVTPFGGGLEGLRGLTTHSYWPRVPRVPRLAVPYFQERDCETSSRGEAVKLETDARFWGSIPGGMLLKFLLPHQRW